MAKNRVHRIVLTVRFDKPCSPRKAAAHVRNLCIGEYFTTVLHEGDPGKFRIQRVSGMPAKPEAHHDN